MTKLRKQRRRKVYRHNVNRKRLRNRLESVGKLTCKEIDVAWDSRRSIKTNLRDMGLAYDPNEAIKTTSAKLKTSLNSNLDDQWTENKISTIQPSKVYVAKALEKDAKAPREKLFRLPKGQVEWITYLMDKYGKDYKAMARDRKNYYQETWKQLRAKIKRFKNIPEQYAVYIRDRPHLNAESGESDVSSDGEL